MQIKYLLGRSGYRVIILATIITVIKPLPSVANIVSFFIPLLLMQPNILVIGDLILDHYIIGTSTRQSPEAPVPVINRQSEHYIIGGAANVAANLQALGANVTLCGITGIEHHEKFKGLIVRDILRKTTVKTRIMIDAEQICRIDNEDTHPICEAIERRLKDILRPQLRIYDVVILSDYAKGLLTPTLCQWVMRHSRKVIIDPKGKDYTKYKGAYLIKPNRIELQQATGITDLYKATSKLWKYAKHIVTTLSEDGIYYDGETLPTPTQHIIDVTGAGDTVIAVLAYFIANGESVLEACKYANKAASLVIQKLGASTITLDEITDSRTYCAHQHVA